MIMNLTVQEYPVGTGQSVLRNYDGKFVFFLQELRYIIQTLRCHLPLHCSHRCSAGILRLAISPLTIRFHSSALVDIDSQEIQRFRDQFQVFRIP